MDISTKLCTFTFNEINTDWLHISCPELITQEDWPPSSPDFNPLDYCIWGVLEAKVNAKQLKSLDSLKASVLLEWDKLPLNVIHAPIGQ